MGVCPNQALPMGGLFPARAQGADTQGLSPVRRCFYCNAPMLPPLDGGGIASPMTETTDHVFPRAMVRTMPPLGERWHRRNKVRACLGCNRRKADMHPAEWLDTLPRYSPGHDRLSARITSLCALAPKAPEAVHALRVNLRVSP